MEKITISAPGKIIISGEHAVVYGYPALVAAINKRVYLTVRKKIGGFDFRIRSEIPPKIGLGSSAALAVAQAAALVCLRLRNPRCTQENTLEVFFSRHLGIVNEIAFCLEKVTHGNPSGVDNTIATYGGVLLFQKREKPEFLKIKKIPKFLLVNTGKSVETTKEMIENLKLKMQNEKLKFKIKNLLSSIGELPTRFMVALKEGDFSQLKWLIVKNERLLEDLGVVGEKAKKTVHLIEQAGGAAKICGAGGVKKGSGVALVYHPNLQLVEKFCQKNKLEFFRVKLGEEGVRIEEKNF